MKIKYSLKVAALLTCIFLMWSMEGFAKDARLTNVIVTNTRDDLLLYLNVEGAFTEKMKKAIMSGVPAKFSFLIELYKVSGFWFDDEVAFHQITHEVKYDPLKKQFSIRRSWETGNPIVTESLTEAEELMTDVDSLKVIALQKLERGARYQLRAKAELDKLTLPFYLHYVFFFVSLWDFETDWYSVEFIF